MTFQEQTLSMIRTAIALAGVSQRQLAKRINVSESRLSQMLNEKSNLTLNTVDKILIGINK